jgi:hypothetical protein
MKSLTQPYMEVGAGLEKSLKVFRIEGICRLNSLENSNTPKVGIRGRMQIIFTLGKSRSIREEKILQASDVLWANPATAANDCSSEHGPFLCHGDEQFRI